MNRPIPIIYNSRIKNIGGSVTKSSRNLELVKKIDDQYSMIRIVGTNTNGSMVRNEYIRIKMPWDFFLEKLKTNIQLLSSK